MSRIATFAASAPGCCSSRVRSSRTSRRASAPSRSTARFTATALGVAARAARAPIKAALLDQRTLAGLGNIYVDEALWRARIHPLRPAGEPRPRTSCGALHRAIRAALEHGIARQGSTLRDYALPDGGSGPMQDEFKVYGRGGEPCDRCGTPIEKIRVAGRGTWYCPACQPSTPAANGSPASGRRSRGPFPRLDWTAMAGRTTRPRPSCFARSGSARPTASSTSTRSTAAGSAPSRRASARRSRASAPGSSRSRTSSSMLHQGSGELQTVTGVDLIRSHQPAREDVLPARVGLIGAEAMLRLFTEQERNERAFTALDEVPRPARRDPGAPRHDRRSTRSRSPSSSSCSGSPATCRT